MLPPVGPRASRAAGPYVADPFCSVPFCTDIVTLLKLDVMLSLADIEGVATFGAGGGAGGPGTTELKPPNTTAVALVPLAYQVPLEVRYTDGLDPTAVKFTTLQVETQYALGGYTIWPPDGYTMHPVEVLNEFDDDQIPVEFEQLATGHPDIVTRPVVRV